MKKFLSAAVLFIVVILSLACGNSGLFEEAAIAEESRSMSGAASQNAVNTYRYQEDQFKERYDKALTAIENGNMPGKDAPNDSSENGFAMIPLGTEIYGIEAFAVLPVLERDLSEEEMLQLAKGMGGISFEELIDPMHSWMDVENRQTENRPYTWEERIRAYQLEEQYRYEARRAQNQAGLNRADNGNPLCITVPKSNYIAYTKYKIYPLSNMTDEQLLQMIAVRFPIEEVYLKPLEGEIPYSQLEKTVENLVREYSISDVEPEAVYSSYYSTRYEAEQYGDSQSAALDQAKWIVSLHFSKGYDYQITLNAENGSLQSWVRYPIGYFAEKEPKDFKPEVTADSKSGHTGQTKEEMQSAAKAYVMDLLMGKKDKAIIKNNVHVSDFKEYPLYGLRIMGEGSVVNVTLETGEVYQVTVMKNDLSIQGIKILDQNS